MFIPKASEGKTYFHNAGVTKISLHQGAAELYVMEIENGNMREVIDSFKLCRNDSLERVNIQKSDFYGKFPVYSFPIAVFSGAVEPSKEYTIKVKGVNLTQYDLHIISNETALYSMETTGSAPYVKREI